MAFQTTKEAQENKQFDLLLKKTNSHEQILFNGYDGTNRAVLLLLLLTSKTVTRVE
jgi:hypothetical protein